MYIFVFSNRYFILLDRKDRWRKWSYDGENVKKMWGILRYVADDVPRQFLLSDSRKTV